MKKYGWFLLLAVLLLSACHPTTPRCNPADPPRLPPGGVYADELEKVLALTNEARAHERLCGNTCYRAAAPLKRDARLDVAAGKHAEDMAVAGVLSHQTPPGAINYPAGTEPSQRAKDEGYNFETLGENIARGQRSAEEVVAAWLNSPGHCAEMMDPSYQDIGLGHKVSGDGTHYWVQDLGKAK